MYIFVILWITISDILTNMHWYLEILMFLFFNPSSFYNSSSKNSYTWFSRFGNYQGLTTTVMTSELRPIDKPWNFISNELINLVKMQSNLEKMKKLQEGFKIKKTAMKKVQN